MRTQIMALLAAAFFCGSTSADPVATRIVNHINRVEVQPNGDAVHYWHGETKVLDAATLSTYANPSVFSVDGIDNAEDIKGYTLKPDGRKVPIIKVDYKRCPANASFCRPDDILQVPHFPDVEVNDTLVLEVTRHEKPIFPGYYIQGLVSFRDVDAGMVWEFTLPKGMTLAVDAPGFEMREQPAGEGTTYILSHQGGGTPPAVAQYVPLTDRSPRMFVSTFKSYDEFAAVYGGYLLPKTAVTPEVQAKANEITAGVADRREQARLIYQWVQDNIVYEAVEIGTARIIAARTASDTLKTRRGECKDHAILYAALLKAKGIDGNLALVNGTNGYYVPKAPGNSGFNHMITWLPEFGLFADSTAVGEPFGTVPFTLQGKQAVLMGGKGPALRLVPVSDAASAWLTNETAVVLDVHGQLTAHQTTTGYGPIAGLMRTLPRGNVDPERLAEQTLKSHGLARASGSYVFPPAAPATMQYAFSGTYRDRDHEEMLSGKGFSMRAGLSMWGVGDANLLGPVGDSKYKDADPVLCNSLRITDDISLEFPADRRVASLPSDQTVKTGNVDYLAHWSVGEHTVKAHREFMSHFDQPLCTGAVRAEVLSALARIADSHGAEISLLPTK